MYSWLNRWASWLARGFLPLFGRFNVENAVGALAAVSSLGVPLDEALTALRGFRGVKRRQEVRGESCGVTVIDDFAHHPTAVRGSIASLRARFPGRRLIAVFEPRTNTSRRAIFQDDYARAFDEADRAVIRAVEEEPIYSATGPVTDLFSAEQLAADIADRGTPAANFQSVSEIVEILHRLVARWCAAVRRDGDDGVRAGVLGVAGQRDRVRR